MINSPLIHRMHVLFAEAEICKLKCRIAELEKTPPACKDCQKTAELHDRILKLEAALVFKSVMLEANSEKDRYIAELQNKTESQAFLEMELSRDRTAAQLAAALAANRAADEKIRDLELSREGAIKRGAAARESFEALAVENTKLEKALAIYQGQRLAENHITSSDLEHLTKAIAHIIKVTRQGNIGQSGLLLPVVD